MGRSQQFYRLVSSTGAVLGTPYKSKPAGYFCPFGTEPLTASTIVTQINDDERNVSFEQITAHNAYDLATAKVLGVRQWDQYVAMYRGNLDPNWFTVVKVTMVCSRP